MQRCSLFQSDVGHAELISDVLFFAACLSPYPMGVSENRGPESSTLKSRILVISTPK